MQLQLCVCRHSASFPFFQQGHSRKTVTLLLLFFYIHFPTSPCNTCCPPAIFSILKSDISFSQFAFIPSLLSFPPSLSLPLPSPSAILQLSFSLHLSLLIQSLLYSPVSQRWIILNAPSTFAASQTGWQEIWRLRSKPASELSEYDTDRDGTESWKHVTVLLLSQVLNKWTEEVLHFLKVQTPLYTNSVFSTHWFGLFWNQSWHSSLWNSLKKIALFSENKNLIIFLIYSGFLCLASKEEVSGFMLETQSSSAQRNIHSLLMG